jgi:hypothetical protein
MAYSRYAVFADQQGTVVEGSVTRDTFEIQSGMYVAAVYDDRSCTGVL